MDLGKLPSHQTVQGSLKWESMGKISLITVSAKSILFGFHIWSNGMHFLLCFDPWEVNLKAKVWYISITSITPCRWYTLFPNLILPKFFHYLLFPLIGALPSFVYPLFTHTHIHTHTYICIHKCRFVGFPGNSVVKNLPAMQKQKVWSLGWEDPLEKEMTTHSSILSWEIPWTEESGGL